MTITQESSAPLFVVVGSTGMQGSSVVTAIRDDAEVTYRVRAITRDPSKDVAKERAAWGCEVVAADATDVDSLTKAFEGAEAVFAMTNVGFGHGVTDPQAKEYNEGKNQVDAAKKAGVKVFAWAGLPSLKTITNGKYSAAHFEAKAQVIEYARTFEGADFKVYDIQPCGYVSNFWGRMAPRKTPDGSYVIPSLFENPRPTGVIDIEADFGRFVVGAIKSGTLSTVQAAGEYLTHEQMDNVFMKVSGGKTVKHVHVPPSVLREPIEANLGAIGAESIINMILGVNEFGFWGGADLKESHALLGSKPPRTFEESVIAYREKFEKIFV